MRILIALAAAGLMSAGLADSEAFTIAVPGETIPAETPTPVEDIPASISAAKWIHTGTCRDDSPSNSYIRLSFEVNGEVKKAELWWINEQGKGVWLNGRPLGFGVLPRFRLLSEHQKARGGDVAKMLVQGRNVFAISNRRRQDLPGRKFCFGAIVRGEIEYADGRVQEVVSDAAVCRGTGPDEPPSGWQEVGFDDSSWGPCWNEGDARLEPWSRYGDIDEQFCSPTEYAAYRRELGRGFPEARLLSEPAEPKVRIVYSGTTPGIEVNGTVLAPFRAVTSLTWSPDRDALLEGFSRRGVKLFCLFLPDLYVVGATNGCENAYLAKWDLQMRRILALNPDAYFFLNYHTQMSSYANWLSRHPEECVGYAKPAKRNDGWSYANAEVAPSFASKAYRDEIGRFLGQAGAYFRSKPWGRRIIGVVAGYGPSSDGMAYGSHCMPDTGLRMTEAFRRFLAEKYGSDGALQAAWGDLGVTLATATVPDCDARLGAGLYVRNLSDPRDRRLDDYYTAYHREHGDWQIAFGRSVKKAFPGALAGVYFGYVILSYTQEGSTACFERVLASPYIDFMQATTRGYNLTDGLHRALTSVFHRYGKLSLIEGDVRTYKANEDGSGEFWWTCRTPEESRAAVSKFIANALMNGAGAYSVDFGRPKWFNCPEALEPFGSAGAIWRRLFDAPPAPQADVAVVLDPNEAWKDGCAIQSVAAPMGDNLLTYPLQTLNFSGYAYDLYAPEDFLRTTHDYRAVVFLNTTEATPTLAAAARKARHPGATVLWFYAPGLRTERGYSDASMSALTGIDLAATTNAVPLVGKYADGSAYGFRLFRQFKLDQLKPLALKPIAPRVSCVDAAAEVRARWGDDESAAFVRKRLSDGSTALFSGAPLHSCAEWASLFAEAGCHAYTKPGFMVRRNSRLLMVFSGRETLIPMESCVMHGQIDQSGTAEVRLESPAKNVTDLFTGEVVAAGTDSFTLRSARPRVWLLEVVR